MPSERAERVPGEPPGWPGVRLHASLLAPWYTPFLYRLRPVELRGSKELRISAGWRLEVGDGIPEPELTALLVETCDHLEREHLERRGERDAVAWAQAARAESVSAWADYLEGEMGRRRGFERPRFPRGAPRPELFGLPAHGTAEEYYRYFSGVEDEPLALFGPYGPPSGSSRPHEPEPGRGAPGRGHGPRGGGEGKEPAPAFVNLARSEAPAGEAELQAVRSLVRQELRHAAPGSLPGQLAREVGEDGRAAIPWQAELARFVGRSTGRLDYSLLPRPDYARLLATGALASRLQLGSPRTVVVRDTSASMDDELLAAAGTEIRRLAGVCEELTVADADTRVEAVHDARRSSPSRAFGGGGTDMLAAAWETWRARRPECLIVITDGETPWDEASREPPGTIWVILNELEVYVPSSFRRVVRVARRPRLQTTTRQMSAVAASRAKPSE